MCVYETTWWILHCRLEILIGSLSPAHSPSSGM
jgi:hypothetical protein